MALNALKAESLLRRISTAHVKKFATAMETVQVQEERLPPFRTIENDPVNHTAENLGRLYAMPEPVKKQLFLHGGFPKHFQTQIKTFAECAVLVRQPAVEIISYLRQTDYTKPVNRYVLYGGPGCGKTITLAHILHYGLSTKKLIIHVPWVPNWMRRPKEVANSTTKEGFVDLPVDAAAWLIHFKHQNGHLFPSLDLKVTKDYTWSIRETTKSGAPITELIELGINRIKYSSDIVIALLAELKQASIAGKCNILVAIDGFNAFFFENTRVFNDSQVMIPPNKVSLTEAFLDITKYDWCNGAVVTTVDQLAVKNKEASDLPRFQLGKLGFEHMDPFLPVAVDKYTEAEFDVITEYYKDRRWIRAIDEDGLRELQLMSARNPYTLMNLCAPL